MILSPQSAGTYSAMAYAYTLMGRTEDAVEWFHKALGLRRDDTFSTSMLNYVIQLLSEEQLAYPGQFSTFTIHKRKKIYFSEQFI